MSSASLEHTHEEHTHELPLHVKVTRARTGVLMLIVSDAISVVAIAAAGGYLSALNTMGQFRGVTGSPSFTPGLILAITLVLSGLAYYWWDQRVRQHKAAGQQIFFVLSWLLLIAATGIQIWIGANLGYASPFHAYESLILLLVWYSVFHLALTAIIGLLLFVRILRNRVNETPYIAEAVGYWWYYTVIAGLVMWAITLAF